MGTREEDEGGGLYTIQVRVTGPEMATGVRTEGRFLAVFFFFFPWMGAKYKLKSQHQYAVQTGLSLGGLSSIKVPWEDDC